jgi:hypothetical protein
VHEFRVVAADAMPVSVLGDLFVPWPSTTTHESLRHEPRVIAGLCLRGMILAVATEEDCASRTLVGELEESLLTDIAEVAMHRRRQTDAALGRQRPPEADDIDTAEWILAASEVVDPTAQANELRRVFGEAPPIVTLRPEMPTRNRLAADSRDSIADGRNVMTFTATDGRTIVVAQTATARVQILPTPSDDVVVVTLNGISAAASDTGWTADFPAAADAPAAVALNLRITTAGGIVYAT